MITTLGYSWKFTGDKFNPDEVERLTGMAFKSKHSKGDRINQYVKYPYPDGGASLDAGNEFTYRPMSPNDKLLKTIEDNIALLHHSGVEKLVMYYTIGYHAQCNLEFQPEELQRLTAIGAILAISCIELDEETFLDHDERFAIPSE